MALWEEFEEKLDIAWSKVKYVNYWKLFVEIFDDCSTMKRTGPYPWQMSRYGVTSLTIS